MAERLGLHEAVVAKALLNFTPPLARESRVGVLIKVLPRQLRSGYPLSSPIKSSIFFWLPAVVFAILVVTSSSVMLEVGLCDLEHPQTPIPAAAIAAVLKKFLLSVFLMRSIINSFPVRFDLFFY
jgi:hypothetical protein